MHIVLRITVIILTFIFSFHASAQNSDSIRQSVRRTILRNYPTTRPINIEYDWNGADSYNAIHEQRSVEEGRVRKIKNLRMSANVPLLMRKRYYLFSNLSYNGSHVALDVENNVNLKKRELGSHIFGFSGQLIWLDSLYKKPLILSATVHNRIDFGNHVYALSGMVTVTSMIKVRVDERLGIGLIAFIDPSSPTPVLPMVTYYRRINPRLELTLLFPSKIALRKQFENESWLSLLTEFNANVLFSSNDTPPYMGNFQTNIVNLRTGFEYERQVHSMILVGVKGGMQAAIKTRHQKIYASPNDLVAKVQRKVSPYLNISVALVPTKIRR